jgi:hypothetical protein
MKKSSVLQVFLLVTFLASCYPSQETIALLNSQCKDSNTVGQTVLSDLTENRSFIYSEDRQDVIVESSDYEGQSAWLVRVTSTVPITKVNVGEPVTLTIDGEQVEVQRVRLEGFFIHQGEIIVSKADCAFLNVKLYH